MNPLYYDQAYCNQAQVFNLYFAVNCGHPSLLSPDSNRSSTPKIEGYDNLPIEGTTVRLSCPPGSVLIGANSATCSENGRWELNPNGLTCIESNGNIIIAIMMYSHKEFTVGK